MNLKIFIVIWIYAYEIDALTRIKRNSLDEAKPSRVKEDFMVLQNTKRNNNIKEDVTKLSLDPSNNTDYSSKKPNNSKPLAVILKEREHIFKEQRNKVHDKTQKEYTTNLRKEMKRDDKRNGENLDNLFEYNGNSKVLHNRDHKNKHLSHKLHTTSLVGAHQAFEDLSPYSQSDQLMRFGNMMMFKVGLGIPIAPNSVIDPHRNRYQYINEPSFDYVVGSLKPQEEFFREPIQAKQVIMGQPIANQKPLQLTNLMQIALDNLLTDDDSNEGQIEFSCPVHHEKKSLQNNENVRDADIIQMCSCRFIKNSKEGKQEMK